jgi:hypothetical protein
VMLSGCTGRFGGSYARVSLSRNVQIYNPLASGNPTPAVGVLSRKGWVAALGLPRGYHWPLFPAPQAPVCLLVFPRDLPHS